MIDKIKNIFSFKKKEENAMTGGLLNYPVAAVREKFSIREVAFANWTGACINARAKSIAATRLFFQDENGDEVETIYSPLLKKINNSYRLWDFLYLAQVNMCYLGNVYIWFPKYGTKLLTQAYVLPSPSCMVTYGSMGIEKFEMISPKGIINIPPDEILHIKKMGFSPILDEKAVFLGQPVELDIAIKSTFSDMEKMGYIERYMQRDGTTPFIVSDENILSGDIADQFVNNLMRRLPKGYVVAAVLDKGRSIQALQGSETILGGDVNKEIKDIITSAFGVSVPFLTQDNQNYATAKQTFQTFFEYTIEPELKLICEYMNTYLWANGLDTKYKLWYEDLKFIDETLLNQQMEFGFMNGIFDINEYRENLGYLPLTNKRLRDREGTNDTTGSTPDNGEGIIENNQNSTNANNVEDSQQI